MKPTIGSIVHYVFNPVTSRPPTEQELRHYAALVIWAGNSGECTLNVTDWFGETLVHANVTQDPMAMIPGTWHWPERE